MGAELKVGLIELVANDCKLDVDKKLPPSVRLVAAPPNGLMVIPLTRPGCALPRHLVETKPAHGLI